MVCPNCKTECDLDCNFCTACGTRLEVEVQEETPEIVAPVAEQEQAPEIVAPVIVQEEAPEIVAPVAVQEEAPEIVAPVAEQEEAPEIVAPVAVQEQAPEIVARTSAPVSASVALMEPETKVVAETKPIEDATENIAVENVATKAERKFSIGRIILNVFVSLLLVILIISSCVTTATTLILREAVKPKNINEIVSNLPIVELPAAEFGIEDADDETIGEYLEKSFEISGVSVKQIERVYESSTLARFVSDKAAEILDDIKNGEDEFVIENDEIAKLFTHNISILSAETGINFNDTEIDLAYKIIDEIKPIKIKLEKIFGDITAGDVARVILSDLFLYIQLGLILLFTILIGLMNKSVSKATYYLSSAFLAVGAVVITCSIIIGIGVEVLGVKSEVVSIATTTVMSSIGSFINLVGVLTFLLGGVILAFTILARKISKKS